MKEKKIISIYGKERTVIGIVTTALMFISSIIFLFLGFLDRDFFAFGVVLFILSASLFLTFWFIKYLVVFDDTHIKVTTIFGGTKRIKSWNEIKKIEVMKLAARNQSGKYIVLNFSDNTINTKKLSELHEEDYIILFSYSKENLEIIEKNADVHCPAVV
jgi:hypothetical protein